MISLLPVAETFDPEKLKQFTFVEEVVNAVRSLRTEKGIPNKNPLDLYVKKNNKEKPDTTYDSVVAKLCNLSKIEYVDEKVEGALSFIIRSTEFYIPADELIDVEAEKAKLEEELKYAKGFLTSVMKKLGNERFVNNAPPAVVEIEQKKKADAESKIKVIEEQIRLLI